MQSLFAPSNFCQLEVRINSCGVYPVPLQNMGWGQSHSRLQRETLLLTRPDPLRFADILRRTLFQLTRAWQLAQGPEASSRRSRILRKDALDEVFFVPQGGHGRVGRVRSNVRKSQSDSV